jgi:hypothetical protein
MRALLPAAAIAAIVRLEPGGCRSVPAILLLPPESNARLFIYVRMCGLKLVPFNLTCCRIFAGYQGLLAFIANSDMIFTDCNMRLR